MILEAACRLLCLNDKKVDLLGINFLNCIIHRDQLEQELVRAACSGSLCTDQFFSILVENPQPGYFISIQQQEKRAAGNMDKSLNCPTNAP